MCFLYPERLRVFLVCVAAAVSTAACSPGYLAELSFQTSEGSLRVSRLSGDGVELLPGSRARFRLERALESSEAWDLSIGTKGQGRLLARVFSKSENRLPVVQGNFPLLPGMNAELRLAIPAGLAVSILELELIADSSIRVDSLSMRPGFCGAVFGDAAYAIDAASSYTGGASLESLVLTLPDAPGSSLILGLKTDGTLRVGLLESSGARRDIYEAGAQAGVDLGIPVSALGRGARVIVETSAHLGAAFIQHGKGAPLADLYAVLASDETGPSEYSLYRWDLFPETLVFDFSNYTVQDHYLKRLAFFAEKPGFRGRLAFDREIEALHGWNAHDYKPATLSAFFELARVSGFSLNRQELELLDVLVEYGVLKRGGDGAISAGRGAMISISRESTPGLRRTFLDHESAHALFFQDAGYRSLAAQLWDSQSRESARYWLRHLAWRRYDTLDRDLCINELQAYLVQQSVKAAGSYFEAVTRRLVEAYPEGQAAIEADAVPAIAGAISGARILDDYLRTRWGLAAGRFGRLRRL